MALASAFQPPKGCTVFMTVQSRGCQVSQYYRCEQDPEGDSWRADFSADGLNFVSHIDREGQWLESFEIEPPSHETLMPGAEDPASFSELIETGNDTFAFSQQRSDGSTVGFAGFDRLTGDRVTIDGVTLEMTEFSFVETDDIGFETRRSNGQEFIHKEWRLFFGGLTELSADGESFSFDASPVDFVFPGEPGFMSTIPLHGCEATMSSAPAITEPHHDPSL
ncbi:MAG: hypothetical protein R3D84_01450 [Paracoccaceae bacterium]